MSCVYLAGISSWFLEKCLSDLIQVVHEVPVSTKTCGSIMSHLLFSWGVVPLTGGQPERRTLAGSPPQCRSMQWNTCIRIWRKRRLGDCVSTLFHLSAGAPRSHFFLHFLHLSQEAVLPLECTYPTGITLNRSVPSHICPIVF